MNLDGRNIVVLDLITVRSPDDCMYCGQPKQEHLTAALACVPNNTQHYVALGWNNKPALGLSIGCFYDHQATRIRWFDRASLEATIWELVTRQALLVSYNGILFDFVVMRGLLRQEADEQLRGPGVGVQRRYDELTALCEAFKALCATSYDLLRHLWMADPPGQHVAGLNGLDSVAPANGLGAHGMSASGVPWLWHHGRYAHALNFCQDEVYKTAALFAMVCAGQPIRRTTGPALLLPIPAQLVTTQGTDLTSAQAHATALDVPSQEDFYE